MCNTRQTFALDCCSILGEDHSSIDYMEVSSNCEIKVSYDNIMNLPYMFDSQVLGVLGLQQKDVI